MRYLLLSSLLFLVANATEYRSLGDEFIDFNPPKKEMKYHGDNIEFHSQGAEFGTLKIKKDDEPMQMKDEKNGEKSDEKMGMDIEVDVEQKSKY